MSRRNVLPIRNNRLQRDLARVSLATQIILNEEEENDTSKESPQLVLNISNSTSNDTPADFSNNEDDFTPADAADGYPDDFHPANNEEVDDEDDDDCSYHSMFEAPPDDDFDADEFFGPNDTDDESACSSLPGLINTGEDEELSDDPEFDVDEVAMMELLSVCDTSGIRGLYDSILTILRRNEKKGFSIKNARCRATLLDRLKKKVKMPKATKTNVSGRDVVHFSFEDMLDDLFQTFVFSDADNLCCRKDVDERFSQFLPEGLSDQQEVMVKQWAIETMDMLVQEGFDPETDFFLPIMLHADKTGTDVFQRYPLEPWMFTLLLFRRHIREKAASWRHLGFVPPIHDPSGGNADVLEERGSSKPDENMQLHHDFLSVILDGIKKAHEEKPVKDINLGGVVERRRIHPHVAIIMGDQESQDQNCCRKKSNVGRAGRVHRACMCSGVNASNACHSSCSSLVNVRVIKELTDAALIETDPKEDGPVKDVQEMLPAVSYRQKEERRKASSFITRVKKLAIQVLARPHTQPTLSGVALKVFRLEQTSMVSLWQPLTTTCTPQRQAHCLKLRKPLTPVSSTVKKPPSSEKPGFCFPAQNRVCGLTFPAQAPAAASRT